MKKIWSSDSSRVGTPDFESCAGTIRFQGDRPHAKDAKAAKELKIGRSRGQAPYGMNARTRSGRIFVPVFAHFAFFA
jgi:hypothetical protein